MSVMQYILLTSRPVQSTQPSHGGLILVTVFVLVVYTDRQLLIHLDFLIALCFKH